MLFRGTREREMVLVPSFLLLAEVRLVVPRVTKTRGWSSEVARSSETKSAKAVAESQVDSPDEPAPRKKTRKKDEKQRGPESREQTKRGEKGFK